MINYFAGNSFKAVSLAFAMNIGAIYCDSATKNPELTTEEEYYKYGVLHKKDIGCAAEYRAKRAEGRYAFWYYKRSLQNAMYKNINGTNRTDYRQGTAYKEGVCLRNASATGDLKAVTWLLKQRCIFDVPSLLAASALAQKNGHTAIVELLENQVIFPDKACLFMRSCGWSLANERQRIVEKQSIPPISR